MIAVGLLVYLIVVGLEGKGGQDINKGEE